jgi:hypothetical protein
MCRVDRVEFLSGRLRKFEGFEEQRAGFLWFLTGVERPPTLKQISDHGDRYGRQLSFDFIQQIV